MKKLLSKKVLGFLSACCLGVIAIVGAVAAAVSGNYTATVGVETLKANTFYGNITANIDGYYLEQGEEEIPAKTQVVGYKAEQNQMTWDLPNLSFDVDPVTGGPVPIVITFTLNVSGFISDSGECVIEPSGLGTNPNFNIAIDARDAIEVGSVEELQQDSVASVVFTITPKIAAPSADEFETLTLTAKFTMN